MSSLQLLLVVLLSTSLLDLFYSIDRGRTGHEVATFQYLSPVLLFITTVSPHTFYPTVVMVMACGVCTSVQLMVGLVLHRDRKIGHRTSGLLLVFWILMCVYGSFKFRTYILIGLDEVRVHPRCIY